VRNALFHLEIFFFSLNFSSFLAICPSAYIPFGKKNNKIPFPPMGEWDLSFSVDGIVFINYLPVLARNLSLPNMTRWHPQSPQQ